MKYDHRPQTAPSLRWMGIGLVLLLASASGGAQTTINWNNASGGDWGNAANWNPQNVPDAGGEEAVFPVGGGAFTTTLNGGFNLDRVLIDNPEAVLSLGTGSLNCLAAAGVRNAGTLLAAGNYSLFTCHINNRPGGLFRIPDGGTHYFTSDSLNNDGTIHIGTNGGTSGATLYFANGDRLLTGSGECILESGSTPERAAIRPYYGGFAQTAGHTIRGSGGIYSGFTSYGTILADTPGE